MIELTLRFLRQEKRSADRGGSQMVEFLKFQTISNSYHLENDILLAWHARVLAFCAAARRANTTFRSNRAQRCSQRYPKNILILGIFLSTSKDTGTCAA